MNKNVGTVDRIIRIIIALALFSLFFFDIGSLRFLGLIGIIPLATAIFSFCPLYLPLKINTAKKE